MPKTYTSLQDLPGTPVGRCSQILANKLQCWRPGDFLVTEGPAPESAKAPAAKAPEEAKPLPTSGVLPLEQQKAAQEKQTATTAPQAADAPPPSPPPAPYQLCSMHKVIQERADKQGGDKALQAMLGVQLKHQQTPPHPVEEKWPEGTKPQAEKDYEDMMAPEDSDKYKQFQKRLPELEGEESGAATQSNPPTTPPSKSASSSSPTSASTQKEQGGGKSN